MRPLLFSARFALTLAAGLITGLLAAGSLSAQNEGETEPPAGGQGSLTEVVRVDVVNIEVYVTDKRGEPVRGLTRDDFELEIDGRTVPISNFYAVESGRAVTPGEAGEAGEAVEASPPAAAPAPGRGLGDRGREPSRLPEEQRLHLIVYIDNYNLEPFHRNRVMRELRTFLREQLVPGDEVMLASYDRELHIRHLFTEQVQRIANGLSELETVSAQGVHRRSERRDILRRIADSDTDAEALGWLRTHAQSIANDLQFTVNAMRELVGYLAGLPGRKALVYVSDGLPVVPAEELYYVVMQKFGTTRGLIEAQELSLDRRFRELAAHANSNRVSFYTIDARGLTTASASDVEIEPGESEAARSAYIDRVRNSNLQSSIQLLAEATGGQAIINANRVLPPLRKVAQDFRNFYSLGHTLSSAGDGRYHTIKVKVNRKGLEVRHREGFRDKPASVRMTDGTLSALELEFESNPLEVELRFGRAQPQADGLLLVPVQVSVPLAEVTLVPYGETHRANLGLWFVAASGDQDRSEVQHTPLPVVIPSAQLEESLGKRYVYTLNLLMEPGPHRVAVGVFDELAGSTSFLSRALQLDRL